MSTFAEWKIKADAADHRNDPPTYDSVPSSDPPEWVTAHPESLAAWQRGTARAVADCGRAVGDLAAFVPPVLEPKQRLGPRAT